MGTKFTKGPWELEYDEDEGEIFILMGTRLENAGMFQAAHEVKTYDCTYPEDKSHEEMMANSQLMVASPLLYEALKQCLKELTEFKRLAHGKQDFPPTKGMEMADAASRAARGEK